MKRALMDHLRAAGETAGIEGDDWKIFPKRDLPNDPDAGLMVQDHRWANVTIPGYTNQQHQPEP